MLFFFCRHFNDLDHYLGIIYILIKNGYKRKKIKVVFYNTWQQLLVNNQKIKNFENKISFEFPTQRSFITKYFYRFLYLLLKNPKIKPLFYAGLILKKIIINNDYKKGPIWNSVKRIISEAPKNSMFIFDHCINNYIKSFIPLIKKRKFKTVCIPHGLIHFNQKKKYLVEFNKSNHFGNNFDYVVSANDHQSKVLRDEGLKKKLYELGSPRFCKPYVKFLEKKEKKIIFKKPAILFFVERGKIKYGKYEQITTIQSEQQKIVNFLLSLKKNFKILIKGNTRDLDPQQKIFFNKLKEFKECENIDSSVLIKSSELVICGGGSSIIFDVLARNKKLVLLPYFHPELGFININKINSLNYNSFIQFEKNFSKILKNKKSFKKFLSKKNNSNQSSVFNNYIYSDKKKNYEKYYNFFIKIQK